VPDSARRCAVRILFTELLRTLLYPTERVIRRDPHVNEADLDSKRVLLSEFLMCSLRNS
jgi:hypothetical protein